MAGLVVVLAVVMIGTFMVVVAMAGPVIIVVAVAMSVLGLVQARGGGVACAARSRGIFLFRLRSWRPNRLRIS